MSDIDPKSFRATMKVSNPEINFVVLGATSSTGTGAAADSSVFCGAVPYKKWRVINCGFRCSVAGASTVAESLVFGVLGDVAGENAFATFTQDTTAAKNWAAADMYALYTQAELANVLASTNGGTHTVAEGTLINQWQTVQGMLYATKKTVGSSTGTLQPWFLVEISYI